MTLIWQKSLREKGADYVAFGFIFFIVPQNLIQILCLWIYLTVAKNRLNIPVCAIGGINSVNIYEVMDRNPHMVSLISDIWNSKNITDKSKFFSNQF